MKYRECSLAGRIVVNAPQWLADNPLYLFCTTIFHCRIYKSLAGVYNVFRTTILLLW